MDRGFDKDQIVVLSWNGSKDYLTDCWLFQGVGCPHRLHRVAPILVSMADLASQLPPPEGRVDGSSSPRLVLALAQCCTATVE